MSILGYSASYFLPQYWASTPLYGEKLIPLLDYVLSTDYLYTERLASAFYMIENKYKNTEDLPIEAIEDIIDESGYSYVKDLLGQDEESIRLLVYLLVLIHQFKGTKRGIELVLSLLKKDADALVMSTVGNPVVNPTTKDASGFTVNDYIMYTGFTVDSRPFDLSIQFHTPATFSTEQCILSSSGHGFYVGLNTNGSLILKLGSTRTSWNILANGVSSLPVKANTTYYAKLSFDGYRYALAISTDKKKYIDYISYDSNIPTELHSASIYIGVDGSGEAMQYPFYGSVNLTPFATNISSVTITQWYEQFPVGTENTFIVKADLDINLVSTDFFRNFAKFVSRYVYPTLEAFEARLEFKNKLTFIPYTRQRITYVASGDVVKRTPFIVLHVEGEGLDVKENTTSETADVTYQSSTETGSSIFEEFEASASDGDYRVRNYFGSPEGFEVVDEEEDPRYKGTSRFTFMGGGRYEVHDLEEGTVVNYRVQDK